MRPEGRAIFEVERLTKFYGRARGVEDITLSARPGEIFGFLGPNGAGKTTVMRTAVGLLNATSGEARLFGEPVRVASDKHHHRLGYLPADLRLWPGMTARRISDLMIGVSGARVDRKWRDEIAERLELSLDRKVKSLSLGNRQKVGLLLALQGRPELLILDEPTSGLDPIVRRSVLELLAEMARGGATLIYSSHNLPEVEQICARVGILRKGRLAALKTIDEIRRERERRLEFRFRRVEDAPADLPDALKEQYRLVERKGADWQVRYHGSPDRLIQWLAGFQLEEVSSPPVSLEEAFLMYYREDTPSQPPPA